MDAILLKTLSCSLPQSFRFYHLGEITLQESNENLPSEILSLEIQGRAALSFRLRGDVQAAFVLLVDADQDLSMYSEAGNILASRLVTQLAEQQGIDLMLSPPSLMQAEELLRLQRLSTAVTRRIYVHSQGDERVLLETLLFVHSPAEARAEKGLEATSPFADLNLNPSLDLSLDPSSDLSSGLSGSAHR